MHNAQAPDTDDLLQMLRNSPPREICEHGSQRVKCPHCEINALDATIILLTDEIERLRAEVATIKDSLTVSESELAALRGSIAEARLGHLTWVGEDDGGWAIVPDDDGAYWDYEGERVRLLIEPMSSDSSPSSAPVPDRSPGSSTR